MFCDCAPGEFVEDKATINPTNNESIRNIPKSDIIFVLFILIN